MERLCELVRLTRLDQLYALRHTLERRGVFAEIWRDDIGGLRRPLAGLGYSRLMVWERDVVYARRVAATFGLDRWPPAERQVSVQQGAGLPGLSTLGPHG